LENIRDVYLFGDLMSYSTFFDALWLVMNSYIVLREGLSVSYDQAS